MFSLFHSNPALALVLCALIILSVCLHELAHVLAAAHEGDTTAVEMGYLTLNPLKTMGWLSLIALLFFGLAWGAVPVNPARFKRKQSDLIVSLAGPFTNFLLFLFFFLLTLLGTHYGLMKELLDIFFYAGTLNFTLMLFNLIPIAPLDGAALLRHFFPVFHYKLLNSEAGKLAILIIALYLMTNGSQIYTLGVKAFDFLWILMPL